jgi:hypothetical protein
LANKVLGWTVRRVTAYSDDLRAFLQSLQANTGIVPSLGQDRFLPDPLPLINNDTIRRYMASKLKTSLNKPRETQAQNHDGL